ncbi:MAG: DUF370 domain-containing protein [Ruminococcaceae bacterium]|nr:DUF370 domain-containing protein [Oscillospiraceae bacterium]
MFLHLGSDVVVNMADVIAILDLDVTSTSRITREFLRVAEDEGFVVNVSEDLPKSFVITEIDKKSRVFISPISTATLLKRARESGDMAAELL